MAERLAVVEGIAKGGLRLRVHLHHPRISHADLGGSGALQLPPSDREHQLLVGHGTEGVLVELLVNIRGELAVELRRDPIEERAEKEDHRRA